MKTHKIQPPRVRPNIFWIRPWIGSALGQIFFEFVVQLSFP